MKARQWIATLGLLALVLVAGAALVFTRPPAQLNPPGTSHGHRTRLIDESPLETARAIASLASDREEERLAQQVLKLGDHEVDLAFADGLRDAAEHPAPPTPEVRELLARLNRADATVKADQALVAELEKQIAGASGNRKDQLQERLDLTHAQMELDQDEQEDAKEDLLRSGGDPLSRIQRQFNRHEATLAAEASHPRAAANRGPQASA